jgi:hypothetical protein
MAGFATWCTLLPRRPLQIAGARELVVSLLPAIVAALLNRNDQRRADRAQEWRQHVAQTRAREAAIERITAPSRQSRERERTRRADHGHDLEL